MHQRCRECPQLDRNLSQWKSVHNFKVHFYDIHLTCTFEISVENWLGTFYINILSYDFINNPSSNLLLWIIALKGYLKIIISLNKYTCNFIIKGQDCNTDHGIGTSHCSLCLQSCNPTLCSYQWPILRHSTYSHKPYPIIGLFQIRLIHTSGSFLWYTLTTSMNAFVFPLCVTRHADLVVGRPLVLENKSWFSSVSFSTSILPPRSLSN